MNSANVTETISPAVERTEKDIFVELETPRFENRKAFRVAGLQDRFNSDTRVKIPQLWQRFIPFIGRVDGQTGGKTYGVIYNADKAGFNYMAGVEVANTDRLPAELSTVSIPEQSYVVFSHRGHISEIYRTTCTIWNKWIPESGYEAVVSGPNFELYAEQFNPQTDVTGVEIWVAIRR